MRRESKRGVPLYYLCVHTVAVLTCMRCSWPLIVCAKDSVGRPTMSQLLDQDSSLCAAFRDVLKLDVAPSDFHLYTSLASRTLAVMNTF